MHSFCQTAHIYKYLHDEIWAIDCSHSRMLSRINSFWEHHEFTNHVLTLHVKYEIDKAGSFFGSVSHFSIRMLFVQIFMFRWRLMCEQYLFCRCFQRFVMMMIFAREFFVMDVICEPRPSTTKRSKWKLCVTGCKFVVDPSWCSVYEMKLVYPRTIYSKQSYKNTELRSHICSAPPLCYDPSTRTYSFFFSNN